MSLFTPMIGRTIREINGRVGSDELVFIDAETEEKYIFVHEQDCCENVRIEDICGDLSDLIDTPILNVIESTNQNNPPENADFFTWTFYHFTTTKGTVVIRWLGESNGYYSERVSFKTSPTLEEKCQLFYNQKLTPQQFVRYFNVIKKMIDWSKVNYDNPETQELLEKYLSLI